MFLMPITVQEAGRSAWRWVLGLALLLVLTGTLWWMSFATTDESSTEKVTTRPVNAKAVPLDLEQVERVEPARLSLPPATRAWAAPAKATPSSLGSVWELDFGSGGYAPYIQRALASGTPAEALAASHLISGCDSVDRHLELAYKLRSENAVYAASPVAEINIRDMQKRQQYCQTVTPDIKALRGELLAKAVKGKEFGSAAIYMRTVPFNQAIDPQLKDTVVSSIRSDASQGDMGSIASLTTRYSQYGLTEAEARVYQVAYRDIGNIEGGPFADHVKLIVSGFDISAGLAALSSEEQASVKRQAQQIVEAYLKKQKVKTGAGK